MSLVGTTINFHSSRTFQNSRLSGCIIEKGLSGADTDNHQKEARFSDFMMKNDAT